MSLDSKMASDLNIIRRLAEKAENRLKNNNTEKAEEDVQEIKEIAGAWE